MQSIYELTTEEAYRLVSERFGHTLPPLDAIENEDWGRDYVLQHFQQHSAEELAAAGLTWESPTPPCMTVEWWREVCARGIAMYSMPRPMKESEQCTCISKQKTFTDRADWGSSYTFPDELTAIMAIDTYMKYGLEAFEKKLPELQGYR